MYIYMNPFQEEKDQDAKDSLNSSRRMDDADDLITGGYAQDIELLKDKDMENEPICKDKEIIKH